MMVGTQDGLQDMKSSVYSPWRNCIQYHSKIDGLSTCLANLETSNLARPLGSSESIQGCYNAWRVQPSIRSQNHWIQQRPEWWIHQGQSEWPSSSSRGSKYWNHYLGVSRYHIVPRRPLRFVEQYLFCRRATISSSPVAVFSGVRYVVSELVYVVMDFDM